ncbi:putative acetyltransferase [Variovorax sp. PBS-H4]|uniref:GNAT family N-acetyltransferase n=1 Tax=Variovorax sp. PBS-H4 TaxID=434008 RepID=UPI00131845C5|nr:GNAT family N-acetyltransferase [Variovorax sp. PBS-H4]VTU18512.1 putative acetyltransferase [Variovorax sp. PBS-H4]
MAYAGDDDMSRSFKMGTTPAPKLSSFIGHPTTRGMKEKDMQDFERAIAAAGCRIRPAARHEATPIASIRMAAYSQYRRSVPPAVFEAYLDDLRHVEKPEQGTQLLVAEWQGRVVGSVVFYADAGLEGLGLPEGWAGFRKLAVHPDARGRGLGRRLAQYCVARARELGAPTMGIHGSSFMTTACKLYQQMGFVRCPEHDLRATAILGLAPSEHDVTVIAFHMNLRSH